MTHVALALVPQGLSRHSSTSTQLLSTIAVVPAKPKLQAHEKEPAELVHVALAWQLCLPTSHSLKSWQLVPVPIKPVRQAQVNEPALLVHVALAWQLCVPALHSSTTVQVTPFPLYPKGQGSQVNDPAVLTQLDRVWQL